VGTPRSATASANQQQSKRRSDSWELSGFAALCLPRSSVSLKDKCQTRRKNPMMESSEPYRRSSGKFCPYPALVESPVLQLHSIRHDACRSRRGAGGFLERANSGHVICKLPVVALRAGRTFSGFPQRRPFRRLGLALPWLRKPPSSLSLVSATQTLYMQAQDICPAVSWLT
jgi:hypothetical protein